jgi:hypothetical protein
MKTTIELNGIDFDVDFDYQPEEREDGYTRIPAEVIVNELKHQGTDFYELIYEQNSEEIDNLIKARL